MHKVVLLNPPGDKKYIRDYFCAKIAKSFYYYHPIDLLYLSGTLSQHHDVRFIDAIAARLSDDAVMARLVAEKPDWIIFLTAGISFDRDMRVMATMAASLPATRFIGTGDIYREIGARGLSEHPWLDAILLDFSTQDILTYLAGRPAEPIPNIICRGEGGQLLDGKEVHGHGKFHIPMPRWDLVELRRYAFPFARRREFASMLTDFGCAFKCTFCPLSTVGFKLRDLAEVERELVTLKKLGVNEIYFRDQTFGVNKKRTAELCDILARLDFGWTCFTRTDVLDEELVGHMKRGGCHTVMFGIESVNAELLRAYKKNTNADQASRAIRLCKKNGLDVVGFFIIGLPGDTLESVEATIDFACTSGIDFVSFNMAVPRLGSSLRREALDSGIADAEDRAPDSSHGTPSWKNQTLDNSEIVRLQKRAFRRFYLRPRYLIKRVLGIRTLHQFHNMAREGIHLFLR